MKRVVITGLGVVSPIGNDAASFWNSLTECRSAMGALTKVDGSTLRFQNVAEVSDFIAADHFDEK